MIEKNENNNEKKLIPNVVAIKHKDGVHFKIICPYCNKMHLHGRGDDGETYGSRSSHCTSGIGLFKEYNLVEDKNE